MPLSNALELTISDFKAFKQCRRAWDWKASFRRNLVPKSRAAHFWFGELFHKSLEQYYMNNVEPDVYFENEADKYLASIDPATIPHYDVLLEDAQSGPQLLRLYMRWAEQNDDFSVLSMEERLTLRINNSTPGNFFSFRYDMLVQRNGKLYIHDFKTTRQMPGSFDWLVFDDQAVAYQWAFEQITGEPIAGVIYTFIKKKLPVEPKVLKNGTVSTSVTTGMTVESYTRVLRQQHQSLADYRETLEKLEQAEMVNFITRAEAQATDTQKQLMGEQIKALAKMMADPDLYIYPSPDKQRCLACDYRDPCVLTSAGFSPEQMFTTSYKQAEPRD